MPRDGAGLSSGVAGPMMEPPMCVHPSEILPIRIAEFNDAFREALGSTWVCRKSKTDGALPECVFVQGRLMMTQGVAALPAEERARLLTRLQRWKRFRASSDPHGEHDFIMLRVRTEEGVRRVFFKIDYYDAKEPEYGAENPNDAEATLRVGTLMMADEY